MRTVTFNHQPSTFNNRMIVIFITFLLVLVLPFQSRAEDKRVVLRFSDWHLTEDVWNESINEAIFLFHERNPDIRVILEPVSYKEKESRYAMEAEIGAAPDIIHMHAFSLNSFFVKGYAKDLTPFIAHEDKNFLDSWFDLPLELMKYKGRMHGMPGDYMTMVLFYNTELFEAVGLDASIPPKTWDEFLVMAKKLTRDLDGDGVIDQWGFGTVGAKSPGFSLRFSPILWSFGADYLNKDLNRSALNSNQAKMAFRFYVDLYIKHMVIPPGLTAMNPQEVRNLFANKKVAMILGSGWTPPIVNQLNPQLNAFEKLRCAPVPWLEKPVTAIWLSSWVMSSNTKYPEEAWKLMKFITSREMELKWYLDNRVTSSRKDISGSAQEILNDKFASVIASQLPYGKVEPQISQWPQVIDIFTTALREAIVGAKSADEALMDAHHKINALLRQAQN